MPSSLEPKLGCICNLVLKFLLSGRSTETFIVLFGIGNGDMVGYFHEKDYYVDGHELTAVIYTSGLINGRGRFDAKKLPLTTFEVKNGDNFRYLLTSFNGLNCINENVDYVK